MAILQGGLGVMASIYVNGEALREHIANDSETKDLAEQYVEARDGFEFEIWIRLADAVEFRGDVLGFVITVDGNTTDQVFVSKKFVKEGKPLVRQGWMSSKGKMMKYSFKTLARTEDQGSEYQKARLEGLGSIVIEVHHLRRGAKVPDQFVADDNIGRRDELEEMSERLLKGSNVSHSVSYSRTVSLEEKECETRRMKYVDPKKRPAGRTVFHYRSSDALLSTGVISEPTPSTEQIKTEEKASQPRRRKRPSDEEVHIDMDDDGNIVREYVVKKPKPSGEVVDLT